MLNRMPNKREFEILNSFTLTSDYIMSRVHSRTWQKVSGTRTLCIIVLDNGYTVTGEAEHPAHPVSMEVQELINDVAYKDAMCKLSRFMQFWLAQLRYEYACQHLINREVYGGMAHVEERIKCPIRDEELVKFRDLSKIEKAIKEAIEGV